MGTSDLFRNLEWQIETHLVPKTIEHLRKNWSWNLTPEENLTRAVTSVVPFIFEFHNSWGEHMAELIRKDCEELVIEDVAAEEQSEEETPVIRIKLQVLKDYFSQEEEDMNEKYQLD